MGIVEALMMAESSLPGNMLADVGVELSHSGGAP